MPDRAKGHQSDLRQESFYCSLHSPPASGKLKFTEGPDLKGVARARCSVFLVGKGSVCKSPNRFVLVTDAPPNNKLGVLPADMPSKLGTLPACMLPNGKLGYVSGMIGVKEKRAGGAALTVSLLKYLRNLEDLVWPTTAALLRAS